jgi:DNA-binding NarL/FixJ family response regulator
MRIILADHHSQVLWVLKTMLQEESELEIVGEAGDTESLSELAKKTAVDLILVDRRLPGCPIKDLISHLQTLKPRPIVIIMSTNIEDSRMILQAGADAFVSKGEQTGWLLEILHQYATRARNVPVRNKHS